MRTQASVARFFSLLLAMLLALSHAMAAGLDDRQALAGVQEGKAVFDVNLGNPKVLAVMLDVIEETHHGLKAQGVKPDLIVAFRGPSTKLLTKDITAETEAIAARVTKLRDLGIRLEACGISARILGIPVENLIPEVQPVANTFVSLIGYQAKGYALIPIQ